MLALSRCWLSTVAGWPSHFHGTMVAGVVDLPHVTHSKFSEARCSLFSDDHVNSRPIAWKLLGSEISGARQAALAEHHPNCTSPRTHNCNHVLPVKLREDWPLYSPVKCQSCMSLCVCVCTFRLTHPCRPFLELLHLSFPDSMFDGNNRGDNSNSSSAGCLFS